MIYFITLCLSAKS
ncbi:hypothetical protein PIIN_10856 [Serendipita indica DSM 11827]|uniref:Uncharacterized protein n=1 Tax=Serendipita indica (strain DSM 11827) TaxID=1109443 RepID=G4TZX8_SERID|nr:hypothetical protein PIIN_10856 [Serendipita indica DSM 11827]